jgi:hypothetical protein
VTPNLTAQATAPVLDSTDSLLPIPTPGAASWHRSRRYTPRGRWGGARFGFPLALLDVNTRWLLGLPSLAKKKNRKPPIRKTPGTVYCTAGPVFTPPGPGKGAGAGEAGGGNGVAMIGAAGGDGPFGLAGLAAVAGSAAGGASATV